MVRAIKPGHKPVIGREEVTLACIYVLRPGGLTSPVKLGACMDLKGNIEVLQRGNAAELLIAKAYWVPDLNIAQRVLARAKRHVALQRIRGEWYEVSWSMADTRIVGAANELNVPLMTHRDYKSICQSPEELRENELRNYLRRLGES